MLIFGVEGGEERGGGGVFDKELDAPDRHFGTTNYLVCVFPGHKCIAESKPDFN